LIVPSSPITNIVVVMLENRSYDNVFGWLYQPGNAKPYQIAPAGQIGLDGLTGSESNPGCGRGSAPITVFESPGTAFPGSDPGESFSDMVQQVFGPDVPSGDPYTEGTAPAMTMQGFTANYASTNPGVYCGDCMTYFTPAQVPVSAFLARNFAVCDQWFASVPCQTFTNRMFAFCGAPAVGQTMVLGRPFGHPYSMVDDAQYALANAVTMKTLVAEYADMPSIVQALDHAYGPTDPPNWKVYFSDYSIAAITVPYVYRAAVGKGNVNVATYDNSDWPVGTVPQPALIGEKLSAVPRTFVDDVANGTLPKFSFIEPRYASDVCDSSLPPNSNHPGHAGLLPFLPGASTPIDVSNGEALLADIYNALRQSKYWSSVLLIVVYDEHGGMFDHVAPVRATPPGIATTPGGGTAPITIPAAHNDFDSAAKGFGFDYLGCRVPAIIVSPYIAQGTAIRSSGNAPFDHTSIIRTVWDIFGLPASESLTQRDAQAPSLSSNLTSSPSNNTGPYRASEAEAGSQARTEQSATVRARTPEEAQALFNARLTKSSRSHST
jgi:phospholipase C